MKCLTVTWCDVRYAECLLLPIEIHNLALVFQMGRDYQSGQFSFLFFFHFPVHWFHPWSLWFSSELFILHSWINSCAFDIWRLSLGLWGVCPVGHSSLKDRLMQTGKLGSLIFTIMFCISLSLGWGVKFHCLPWLCGCLLAIAIVLVTTNFSFPFFFFFKLLLRSTLSCVYENSWKRALFINTRARVPFFDCIF